MQLFEVSSKSSVYSCEQKAALCARALSVLYSRTQYLLDNAHTVLSLVVSATDNSQNKLRLSGFIVMGIFLSALSDRFYSGSRHLWKIAC